MYISKWISCAFRVGWKLMQNSQTESYTMQPLKVNVFFFKFKLVGFQSLQIRTFSIKPLDDFQQQRILTQTSLVDWAFVRQALRAKLSSLGGEGGFNPSISGAYISQINSPTISLDQYFQEWFGILTLSSFFPSSPSSWSSFHLFFFLGMVGRKMMTLAI